MIKILIIGIGIYALYRMSLNKRIPTDKRRDDGLIEDVDYEEIDND